jgi:hypothetical protein
MDLVSQTLQALGYLLSLVLLTVLWINAKRQAGLRRFWVLLALAWSMNLLGSIGWIIHGLVTQTPLATFSIIDIFYVAHYVLIVIAIWKYPASLVRRAWWLWAGAMMLATSLVIWGLYFGPATAIKHATFTDFLGIAMYPVLDAGLITLVWLYYRAVRGSKWERVALLLLCAMTSYGLANTLNLTEYVFPPMTGGLLPNLFWLLTDVFVLIMALRAHPNEVQAQALV